MEGQEFSHRLPMHLSGAFVLGEFIVFVRSLVPCNGRYPGRSLRGRLQVMGGSVSQLVHYGGDTDS